MLQRDYGSQAALRSAMEEIYGIDPSKAGQAYVASVAREATRSLVLTPPTRLIQGVEDIRLGDLTFTLLPTPGIHTASFLLVYIPELGLLVAPKEIGMDRPIKPLPETNPSAVISSLRYIQASEKPLEWLLGHFAPIKTPDLNACILAWQSF